MLSVNCCECDCLEIVGWTGNISVQCYDVFVQLVLLADKCYGVQYAIHRFRY